MLVYRCHMLKLKELTRMVASEARSASRFASSARSSAMSASIWAVSTERSGRMLRVDRVLRRLGARL